MFSATFLRLFIQVAPVFTVPLVLMVIYDFPRDRPWCYQLYLTFSVWIWPLFQSIAMCVPPPDFIPLHCSR